MKYKEKIIEGRFISRPNRFVAEVECREGKMSVHVKNTGRCRELLVEGAKVYLAVSEKSERKYPADLIAVVKKTGDERGEILVNIDSQLPNAMAREWLEQGALFGKEATVRPEVTKGNSRFDFYIENGARRAFLEVKGVTLEEGGVAMFPDAPTERGVKHLRELTELASEGFEAYVLFVVQMKGIASFTPNRDRDPAFADALLSAKCAGVNILCYDSVVTPDGAFIDSPIPVVI